KQDAAVAATAVTLTAATPGSWGNEIQVNVSPAEGGAVVAGERRTVGAGGAVSLLRKMLEPDLDRARVRLFRHSTGQTQVLDVEYGTASTAAGKAAIDPDGAVHFHTSELAAQGDVVIATYVVPKAQSRTVTLRRGTVSETYTVADGVHLAELLAPSAASPGSALATGDAPATSLEVALQSSAGPKDFSSFGGTNNTPGTNNENAGASDYATALEALTNEDAHIIVAAGKGAADVADVLTAHVQNASTDLVRRDRIAVVGSGEGATFDQMANHNVASDRVVFVAPGIRAADAAVTGRPDNTVILPGAYAAAAVAGMLASRSPHVSLTNKVVSVKGLDPKPTPAQLERLVQNRVLALEERSGVRVVKAVTTDDGAFRQITTRRIVDYAKFGVRSAAQPFIGLLNNDRVRKSMHGSINGFLASMVDDEMLTEYQLAVTATRDEEIRGIARVTMTVKPTFSIDYLKVTMTLG
ncbi:MAG TPA: phage tail sheath subtilisin-like domain-containing protein, partial [Longimicrobium sp.]|nr:phage tail sheath subtilisin-like domain-containing protein [Longimicrobium sp.]